ncbi:uncharacterized mitochondrial protein AtMg00860-like [Lycium ferocissimum]|uniref:uncharacterized mitochondrial protein AtMg00860-like n=1 Tax=Lycium ferocissimum TaxID=112874 RepID=UPI0028162ED1|nr:uncharacterized mitochondrial protein AtMg00860-like [Lycium ferocissimum]
MVDWPRPTTLRALRGFLGLTGYYGKWNHEAELAFIALKRAMSTTPVLSFPNYLKEFLVETDARHWCSLNVGWKAHYISQ